MDEPNMNSCTTCYVNSDLVRNYLKHPLKVNLTILETTGLLYAVQCCIHAQHTSTPNKKERNKNQKKKKKRKRRQHQVWKSYQTKKKVEKSDCPQTMSGGEGIAGIICNSILNLHGHP